MTDAVGGSAWVIESEKIAEIVPEAWKRLMDALAEEGEDLESLAFELRATDIEEVEVSANIRSAFYWLQEEFKRATTIEGTMSHYSTSSWSLELILGYYDSESGGAHDELEDGSFWMVEGVTIPTPPGRKLIEEGALEYKSWVVYG